MEMGFNIEMLQFKNNLSKLRQIIFLQVLKYQTHLKELKLDNQQL